MMKGIEMRKARNSNAAKALGKGRRIAVLAIVVCLLGALTVGGTLAFLTTNTDSVENKFMPVNVSCKVHESFNGSVKTDINVKNTGDINAYIRVKLVSYRVNSGGNRIGGKAEIPSFHLGTDWVKRADGYYYYRNPVAPNESPAVNLNTGNIQLKAYNDADGGKQVIEVMAEAIQSEPTSAVQEAWSFIPGGSGN